jgi:hypothetical protein
MDEDRGVRRLAQYQTSHLAQREDLYNRVGESWQSLRDRSENRNLEADRQEGFQDKVSGPGRQFALQFRVRRQDVPDRSDHGRSSRRRVKSTRFFRAIPRK